MCRITQYLDNKFSYKLKHSETANITTNNTCSNACTFHAALINLDITGKYEFEYGNAKKYFL